MLRAGLHKLLPIAAMISLVACSATPEDEADDEGALAAGTLSYVGQHVVDVLSAESPTEEGKTWSLSRGNNLPENFVLQIPLAETWGARDIRVATRCRAGAEKCNDDFLLSTCSSDADCGAGGKCSALKATVAHRGAAPIALCIGHSDALLDEVWSAIALAQESVDLSSLTPPQGRFEAAVRNAVTYASEAAAPPRVRMLFGDYPGAFVSADKTLERLTRDVAPGSRIDVSIGTFRDGVDSWNHSKIIVRDQAFGIAGGTNMWDEHYLEKDPVHDIWMAVEGNAARDASRYLDSLWTHACGKSGLVDMKDVARRSPGACPTTLARSVAESGSGGVPMIAAGRLGRAGANTSDKALVALVESARKSLHLSQQDIGPVKRVGVSFAPWPEELMVAMVAAMARGVDVSFVLSNSGSVPGNVGALSAYFNTYDNGWSPEDVAKKFAGVAAAHRDLLGGRDPVELVCAKLKLMRLRMGDGETWADRGTLANHAKVIVVDERAFYVGSQNTYVANLAEFGFIVDDAAATQRFIAGYLERAERWSRRTAIGAGASCNIK